MWLLLSMLAPVFIFCQALAFGQALNQAPDPAYDSLTKAYEAMRARDYDQAIILFLKSIEAAPNRAYIHKDLAYTYLKVGETEAARDQFGEAMRLDPADTHVALEYGFLCYETKQETEARRIFDRVRKTEDPASRATAEQAFQNIDQPLKAGIERWSKALAMGQDSFSVHFELAQLAEHRDELELAAEHYGKAWRFLPERKSVLLDLGRVWKALGKSEQANSALLAASRGGEPRSAEAARELLPARYPFINEFRQALELDPKNVELRRELAYLLLKVGKQAEAEQEFKLITRSTPDDLLSAAQLGFLYLGKKNHLDAMPLLERVLKGNDRELASRVRTALHLPPADVRARAEPSSAPVSSEAKLMAERSLKAGYLKDALKYLTIAHEDDPIDFSVMLKLGWTYNTLHDDNSAVRWFALARKSPDPQISAEAGKAYNNLRPSLARVRTTVWLFPFYSSRWRDVFSYGQIKTEFKLGNLPLRPYVSTRFIGDTKRRIEPSLPQYLSESSFIFGFGIATRHWKGLMAWGEAGEAVSYLGRRPNTGLMKPDYRGGVSFARGFGHGINSGSRGLFFETNADGVFVSRFQDDVIGYSQNRLGFTPGKVAVLGGLETQFYWNGNLTFDAQRQYWANFAESGPGVRFRWPSMPSSLLFSVNVLRGSYTVNQGNPRKPNFFDIRAGFWYALSH